MLINKLSACLFYGLTQFLKLKEEISSLMGRISTISQKVFQKIGTSFSCCNLSSRVKVNSVQTPSTTASPPIITETPPALPITKPTLEKLKNIYFIPNPLDLEKLSSLDGTDAAKFQKDFVSWVIHNLALVDTKISKEIKNRAILRANEVVKRHYIPNFKSPDSALPQFKPDECLVGYIFPLDSVKELKSNDDPVFFQKVHNVFMAQVGEDFSVQQKEELFKLYFEDLHSQVSAMRAQLEADEGKDQKDLQFILLPKEAFEKLSEKGKPAKTRARKIFEASLKNILLREGVTPDKLYQMYRTSLTCGSSYCFIEIPQKTLETLKKLKGSESVSEVESILGEDFIQNETKRIGLSKSLFLEKLRLAIHS